MANEENKVSEETQNTAETQSEETKAETPTQKTPEEKTEAPTEEAKEIRLEADQEIEETVKSGAPVKQTQEIEIEPEDAKPEEVKAEEVEAEETKSEEDETKTQKTAAKTPGTEEAEDDEDEDVDLYGDIPAFDAENFNWEDYEEGEDQYSKEERADLDALYDDTLNAVQQGEVVVGTVVDITKKEVVVNINYKSEIGRASCRERV